MRRVVAGAVVVGVFVAGPDWPPVAARAQAPGAGGGGAPTRTVVVDPGHGGDDPGAMGPGGTEEKALTLSVAQRLRTLLQARGFRVVVTREDDRRLTADQRAALANGSGAEVFVSLHANASPSPTTAGAEVGSLLVVADRPPGEAGYDDPAPLVGMASGLPRRVAVMRWNRAQVPHHEQSARLAQDLGRRLGEIGRLGPRGVYRAPLKPLVAVAAPAVLVELGYLSNGDEESALGSEERQVAVAQAISQAVDAMTTVADR